LKDYVVMQVTASPDGRPEVLVVLQENCLPVVETLVRAPAMPTGANKQHRLRAESLARSFVAIDYAEYQALRLRVGDRVRLRITRSKLREGNVHG
jgi:ABC-type arginine transport system ATPase subunit